MPEPVDPDVAALLASTAGTQAAVPSTPQTMVDDHGNPQVVQPDSIQQAHAEGWHDVSAAEAHELSVKQAALAEAGEHPIEAGAVAAGGSFIPGGRRLISEAGGPDLPRQKLLEEANPVASTVGNLAGTGAQIAGVTALTGGLGDLAEGAGMAAKGAQLAGRLGTAAAVGGAQGLTGGMTETDLGNTAYNAEALAQDAGLGTILGLGGESALALGESVVPKVIGFAKRGLSSLEDSGLRLFGKASAAVTHNPEVEGQVLKAADEMFHGAEEPISKAGKLAAKQDLNEAAVDFADKLQGSLDRVADVDEKLWGELRPTERENLGSMHDEAGGVDAAKKATQDLIEKQLEPALSDGLGGWKGPQDAALKAVAELKKGVQSATTSAAVHEALTEARRTIDQTMRFGSALGATGDEKATAAAVQAKILGPMKNLMGRYVGDATAAGGARTVTPEAIAAFGPAQAARNAEVNEAFSQMSTARSNLMKRLGYTDLGENGRPLTQIKPSRVLSLIKGEGGPGEVASSLTQQEAKEALDRYITAADNYADVASESARSAVTTHAEPDALKSMLGEVAEKRAAAQGLLEPSETQKLAEMTSRTGEGAGGLRGKIENQGTNAAAAVFAATGNPVLGGAIAGVSHAYSAVKYPVETLRAYASIRQAAARAAGTISSGVRAFLSSSARAPAAGLLGRMAPSIIDDQKRFSKISKQLSDLEANPSAGAHMLAENTAGIAHYAPQHGVALAGVSLRAHQVLSVAVPKNQNPSPLGPGQDHWQPNPQQLLDFDQVQQAVLHPKSIGVSLQEGSLTPKAWQAYKTVYPEHAADWAQQALLHVAKHNDQELTIGQKLGLSMIAGRPLSNDVKPEQVQWQASNFQAAPQKPPQGGKKPTAKGLEKINFANAAATPQEQHQMEKTG